MSLKTRNGGQWTEARFYSFIKSALRAASSRWGPKNQALKLAWVSRGMYKCALCAAIGQKTLPALPGNKRRRNNAAVDHITPIIDPDVGFTTWDDLIARLFCEVDNYQVLCYACHKTKTASEREIATSRRRNDKK